MAIAFRASLLAGTGALLLHAAAARAADVTQAQAAEVEGQVRNWLTSMLGPNIPVAARPIVLTANGDHFDVLVPIKPQADATSSEIRITATARPLEGGKWSIEGIKTTNPMRFTIDLPAPPVDGKPATPATIPVAYAIDVTGQDGTIIYDPSFATPSTTTSSVKGVTVRATGGPMSSMSSMGASSSVSTIRPAGPDRVDVAIDGTLSDYRISTGTPEAGPIDVAMKLVRVNMGMNGVSRTRSTIIVQTMATAFGALLTAPPGSPPNIAPELGKQVLAALQDLASELNLEESFEGLDVKANGINVLLAKAKFGFGAKSNAGVMQARMALGAEGLKTPGLDLGPMMALMPGKVEFLPFVSGVGVAELTRLLQSSSEKKDPSPQDIAALFSHGGLVTGLESMYLDVGGSIFTGQGKVTFTSPQQFSGAGQITAEGFDDLVEKVSDIPEAAQAVPVLALVKGLGRNVNDKLVWNISYNEGKLLVNNVDVMKMMGGGGPPPRGNQQGNRPQQRR